LIIENNFLKIKYINGDWGLGIGDWGLAQSPIPNPQSPIPIIILILVFIKYNN